MLIKNPILKPLQTLLGMSPGTQPTSVDLSNASLTVPILPDLARRSGQLIAGQGGWFTGLMENVHSAGDNESSTIDPYNPGTLANAPFPEAVDTDYDLWLLKVGGRRSAGSGGLTGAVCSIIESTPQPLAQAWSVDDAGVAVATTSPLYLAEFDAISPLTVLEPMITETGSTVVNVNMRLPRGILLRFHSTSAAAAEFQMWFMLGLFPAGLGQDAVT